MVSSRCYQIMEPLGRGGFGTVYRARFLGDGGFWKPVALKVLNANVADNPEIARRLRDEARLLGMIRHRSIVQVDRLARLGGRWAVIMEYVEGIDLAAALQAGPLPATVALELIGEVAAALDAAWHQAGPNGKPLRLQHRDLKPSNIQITATGEVKLLDFGIARAEYDDREALTRSLMFGSPPYMAPERLALEDSDTADIYALGAVLFELLTAQRLGQTAPDPGKHRDRLARGIGRLAAAGVAPPVCTLVAHLLAHEPSERPSADALVEITEHLRGQLDGPRLRSWARELVPPLRDSQPPFPPDELSGTMLMDESTPALGPSPTPAPGRTVAEDPSLDSSPVRWLMASVAAFAFVCVLTIGGLLLLWWTQRGPPEQPAIALAAVAAPVQAAPVQAAPEPAPAPVQVAPVQVAPEAKTKPPTSTATTRPVRPSTTTPETTAALPVAPPGVPVYVAEAPAELIRLRNAEYGTVNLPGLLKPGTWQIEMRCHGSSRYGGAGDVSVHETDTSVTIHCNLSSCNCSRI